MFWFVRYYWGKVVFFTWGKGGSRGREPGKSPSQPRPLALPRLLLRSVPRVGWGSVLVESQGGREALEARRPLLPPPPPPPPPPLLPVLPTELDRRTTSRASLMERCRGEGCWCCW